MKYELAVAVQKRKTNSALINEFGYCLYIHLNSDRTQQKTDGRLKFACGPFFKYHIPMKYRDWAKALDIYWSSSDEQSLVLHVEGSLLPDIASFVEQTFESVAEAESDFVSAIRSLQKKNLSCGQRYWQSEPFREGQVSEFLLLIAAQVYAASKMANSEDYTDRAYYVQLHEITGRIPSNPTLDLKPDQHKLWRTHLSDWLKLRNKKVTLPGDDGRGRYVNLPKSQVVLRVEDLRQLPLFFRASAMGPGKEIGETRFLKAVEKYKGRADVFPSSWSRRILDDPLKAPIAIQQIKSAFSRWDGRWEIPQAFKRSRREQRSRLGWWIGVSERKRKMNLWVGRDLEESRRSNLQELESYLGAAGPVNEFRSLNGHLLIGKYSADKLAFEQVDYFEPGDRGLIAVYRQRVDALSNVRQMLASTKLVSNICELVERMEDTEARQIEIDGLTQNLFFATFELADPLPPREVDEIWHQFLSWPRPKLVVAGGLRFGKKDCWIAGAGPLVEIHGPEVPQFLELDGEQVPVSGRIFRHPRLSSPGQHTVCALVNGVHLSAKVNVSDFASVPDVPQLTGWSFQSGKKSWPIWTSEFLDPLPTSVLGLKLNEQDNINLNTNQEVIRLLLSRNFSFPPSHRSSHPVAQMLQRRQKPQRE